MQSSFIPQDAGNPAAVRVSRGGLGDLVLIFSIVAFAASCALAGAVFLYQQYLTQQSTSDVAQLQRAESDFQPSLVQQLVRLDQRIQAANDLLASHIAPTAFFEALNQVTLQTISFSSLTFEATDPSKIQVKLQGVADSVNSIAYQANLLSKSGVFSDPIFSGIQRQSNGVVFTLTMLVNPSALNYEALNGAASGSDTAAPAPETAATSTGGFQSAPATSTGTSTNGQ